MKKECGERLLTPVKSSRLRGYDVVSLEVKPD